MLMSLILNSYINCAGMALLRVFQGSVDVLGYHPPLGVYCSLYSPKWNNLLVIEGRTGNEECQAPFGPTNLSLLQATEPTLPAQALNEDEEIAADRLAMQLVTDFPIVLVLRAIPVSFGNITSFYENSRPQKFAAVLPGFKMIVSKQAQKELNDATGNSDTTAAAPADTRLLDHSWKEPERVLAEIAVADSFRTVQITERWQATVDRLETSLLKRDVGVCVPQKIVVCGGKGVGKSTFCRYLVNRLLAHFGTVAFLDTDLGQSELTPPGLVALHALTTPLLGPGFSQMKNPIRSFFCGDTNPGNDPLYYMKAVKSLLRLYDRKWGTHSNASNGSPKNAQRTCVPLVVNTDGWIKSMGHDLLCNVIQETNPDHVVQMLAATKNKQFDVPTGGRWRVHGVQPWDPVGVSQPPRSSKELRLYRLHTYFLARTPCDLTRTHLQNLHVLSEKNRVDGDIYRAYIQLTPFAVSFDQVDIAFAGSSVPPSQLLFSLNASLVGLCVNAEHQPLKRGESEVATGPPRIVLQPVHPPCVGVGIIRAVDAKKRLLFILSPLPISVLKRVNLLVRSSIPLTTMLLSAHEPAQVPYIVTDVVASDGTGSSVMQSRNNLKRKRDGK
ncbi:hypothetical protein BBJ29_001771 [Phytophthora kernoviae]|uniref:Uncharacterized protein n=1 Tax=Phytophthora kernoviae TaxID=325452 RepID=A0A3F2S4E0_9STRA|nr:hypothetical protein BBJ29_001771 [Phytophthora kernoviae]RLN69486.1 hypothetical protein BBP00_00000319 [Phytophthora kernoviae]